MRQEDCLETWQNTPGFTETLVALTDERLLFSLESLHMHNLKRFVVIMYSKGCGLAMVNEARHRLFTSGKRTLENILLHAVSHRTQHKLVVQGPLFLGWEILGS